MKKLFPLFSLIGFLAASSSQAGNNIKYQTALVQTQIDAKATLACIEKQYAIAKNLKSQLAELVVTLAHEKAMLCKAPLNVGRSYVGEMIEFERQSMHLAAERLDIVFTDSKKFMSPFAPFITNKKWDLSKVEVSYGNLKDLQKSFVQNMSELREAKEKFSERIPEVQEITSCEAEFAKQLSSTYSLAYESAELEKQQN